MMRNGHDLWPRFRDEFLSAARRDPERARRLLSGPTERTKALGLGKRGLSGLLPELTKALGMERFDQEYLGADGVFVDKGGWPMIYVESENEPGDAWREIERFCYLRAPLKVLITITPSEASLHEAYRKKWVDSIKESQEGWCKESGDAVYGFLVLEILKKPNVDYNCFAIGPNGEPIED